MPKRQYYIPYVENTKINYSYLLALYKIADFDVEKRIYNTIRFDGVKDLTSKLSSQINLSMPTVSRILRNEAYKDYFTVDYEKHTITLNNDIRNCKKFVVLNESEVDLIISQNDDLFSHYFLYLKYFINYSKSKEIDSTASQILDACGYSSKSNSNKSKLCSYGFLLEEEGIITIERISINGKQRNLYRLK